MNASASRMELANWDNRSWTTANMLNPALIAASIIASANMYENESGEAMPWELAFLTTPMVLHHDTREALPDRINSYLAKWVVNNSTLLASLPTRVESMRPYTREAIRYGLRTGALEVIEGGLLRGTPTWKVDKDRDGELWFLVNRSAFLGRWLAATGSPATLFALFSVAP